MIFKFLYYFNKGNQCRQFLKQLDSLQEKIKTDHSQTSLVKALPFLEAARSLSQVVSSCFGVSISASYLEDINTFEEKYLQTGLSMTPKVIFHIKLTILHANTGTYLDPTCATVHQSDQRRPRFSFW